MKKIASFIFLIFVVLFCIIFTNIDFFGCCFAENCNNFNIESKFYNESLSIGCLHSYAENLKIEKNKYSDNLNLEFKKKLLNKILGMGVKKCDALNYCFYGLKEKCLDIENKINKTAIDCEVKYDNNTNKFFTTKSVVGYKLNLTKFYESFFDCIKNKNNIIKLCIDTIFPKITEKDIKINLRSTFSTGFENSSENRKHNIHIAINKIAGTILKPGEIFSFNKVTGSRDENAGYVNSKIIVGGKFVDGLGGGVCQVSSTLFNAVLLAGLEVVESHPHSLSVGYVEPGFDAMVNFSSADLRFKNNTQNNIYISAIYQKNCCNIQIFGEKSQIMVKKRFEIVKNFVPADYEYVYDVDEPEAFGRFSVGDCRLLVPQKEGCLVNSFVDIYEKNKKIKTIMIRKSTYASQRGKIVIGTAV